MVFGGGLIGGELGLAETMKVGPWDGISAFEEENPESFLHTPHHVRAQ